MRGVRRVARVPHARGAANNHDRSGVAYVVVPLRNGAPPPSWPEGFDRAALRRGPIAAVSALLADNGLPPGGHALERRSALAQHIGAALL